MRYAIVSDVHGNYPALLKVVEDAQWNGADRFILIGDYIFDLPFSNQVIECIAGMRNADILLGNKEIYLQTMRTQDQSSWIYDQMGPVYQTFRELSSESFAFISTLRESAYLPLETGGFIYASHFPEGMLPLIKRDCSSPAYHTRMLKHPFTREQYQEYFSGLLRGREYRELFEAIGARVILFGHNHLQCHGYCGDALVINPGSCGQPLDFDNRAAYTILEELNGELRVWERRVEYDIEATIAEAKKSQVYVCGSIWCELAFLALRTGRDYYRMFFEIASQIAEAKGESGSFFANATWNEAYITFRNMGII